MRFLDRVLPGSRRVVAAAAEAGRDRQVPGAPRRGSGPRGQGGGTSGSLETREGEVCAPCVEITPRFLSATTDTQERRAPPRNQSPFSAPEQLGGSPSTRARSGRSPARRSSPAPSGSTRSRANPEAQPLRAQRSEKPRVGLQPACHPPAPAPLDLGCPWAFRGLLPADTQGRYTD